MTGKGITVLLCYLITVPAVERRSCKHLDHAHPNATCSIVDGNLNCPNGYICRKGDSDKNEDPCCQKLTQCSISCQEPCEYGYVLDKNKCPLPTCQCKKAECSNHCCMPPCCIPCKRRISTID